MGKITEFFLARRGFLGWALKSLLGVAGAAFVTGFLAYLYPPALRRGRRVPVPVPAAGSLPVGGSVPLRVEGEAALLLKAEGGFRAFSLTCTHLGCVVEWRPGEGRGSNGEGPGSQSKRLGLFVCPCHGGVFDDEGRVIAGPPPRALERLEVLEREGQVVVV